MCDTFDHQNMLFNFQKFDLFVPPFFSHLENSNLSSTTLVDLKKRGLIKGWIDKKSIGVMRQTIFFFL